MTSCKAPSSGLDEELFDVCVDSVARSKGRGREPPLSNKSADSGPDRKSTRCDSFASSQTKKPIALDSLLCLLERMPRRQLWWLRATSSCPPSDELAIQLVLASVVDFPRQPRYAPRQSTAHHLRLWCWRHSLSLCFMFLLYLPTISKPTLSATAWP